ncbi:putative ALA-interacting subunit 2 isoform X2 [Arachis stenosperma]|nr:putative ALA-interacting subunit 2 isoform X2 [Arachis stenosperma]
MGRLVNFQKGQGPERLFTLKFNTVAGKCRYWCKLDSSFVESVILVELGKVKVMDLDSGTSSTVGARVQAIPGRPAQHGALYQFKQQNLPACKPVLTPATVIATFLLMGFIFIPLGLITLRASNSVVEIVDRYDIECIPEELRSNKLLYITDDSISKNCSRFLKVPKSMRAPIYIYYQLDNYYQNHRRYVKSRNDKQLLHGLGDNSTSSCKPLESSGDLPIVPCGLIAWSVFNDTFKFSSGSSELKVNRKNIAWKSDRNHKFGKDVYPFNFQNGPLIGGGKLDPNTPLSDQEDLIVWMRTAALPSFRKLYGRIEEDLDADDVIVVQLMNNYNAYSFGGKKKLVLSTSSWLGGKNDFFGVASLFIGTFCMLISIVFLLLHVKNPRPYGDAMYTSWNKKSSSS